MDERKTPVLLHVSYLQPAWRSKQAAGEPGKWKMNNTHDQPDSATSVVAESVDEIKTSMWPTLVFTLTHQRLKLRLFELR